SEIRDASQQLLWRTSEAKGTGNYLIPILLTGARPFIFNSFSTEYAGSCLGTTGADKPVRLTHEVFRSQCAPWSGRSPCRGTAGTCGKLDSSRGHPADEEFDDDDEVHAVGERRKSRRRRLQGEGQEEKEEGEEGDDLETIGFIRSVRPLHQPDLSSGQHALPRTVLCLPVTAWIEAELEARANNLGTADRCKDGAGIWHQPLKQLLSIF